MLAEGLKKARRSLLQSPNYIQHKGEDMKAFIAAKQKEEPDEKI